LDPNLVEDVLRARSRAGRCIKAIVPVHIYGQTVDLDPILEMADRYGAIVVEDVAEALGATYKGRLPGLFGQSGVFSFNGNKMITTGGGGMLVTQDPRLAEHARKLATQARDHTPHYQHSEVGYNYRLSNVLAGVGLGQLCVLDERIVARRANFAYYVEALRDLPGIGWMPEAPWGRHARWLSCVTFDPAGFGATREDVRLVLEAENIESRPLWKPMHQQPVYASYDHVASGLAEHLFEVGLCLPSGSGLTEEERARVVAVVRAVAERRTPKGARPVWPRGAMSPGADPAHAPSDDHASSERVLN
ncbi:MAG TPA: DegT/DnrJ/EryC1/StrS family aminotransferase, partial [Rhodothermales bacterium]|nr:DegT/DnrJ/EryC1/StrS family aminotransferase [Rhodothermales bacterium]